MNFIHCPGQSCISSSSLTIAETLLDAHESEVLRLREFYDRRMKVYVALENWIQLWDQFVEFEKRANDPNRFSKRGGGLLQVGAGFYWERRVREGGCGREKGVVR